MEGQAIIDCPSTRSFAEALMFERDSPSSVAGFSRARILAADLVAIAFGMCGVSSIGLALSLPSNQEIDYAEASARDLVAVTLGQVRVVRSRLGDVDVDRLNAAADTASRLTKSAAVLAVDVNVDFDAIERASEALGTVAEGLDALAPVLSADTIDVVYHELDAASPVSYTHLTLPTILRV